MATQKLVGWSGIARSSFYYRRSDRPRGRKPTTHTRDIEGKLFENQVVVQQIEQILLEEFCCYGYQMMTSELQAMGWIINDKKVYRLMGEHHLLFNTRIRARPGRRDFVRFRRIKADRPLQYLCMDIKYVHIHGQGRNALLLTVMDVFTRRELIHTLRFNIRKGDVLVMLSLLLLEYRPQGMVLRNDNGSQFIAAVVRQFLREKGIYQEFTHVATPEENAYIEALHSNLQREVIERFEFDSIYHAQMVFNRYFTWYNEKRRHGSLGRVAPIVVWENYYRSHPMKTTNLLYGPVKTVQEIGG